MRKPACTAEFIEWDVRNWSVALDFWLDHTTQNLSMCSALELGSQNGGLSLWMALQGAHVVSSDVDLPDQTALRIHKLAVSLTHSIRRRLMLQPAGPLVCGTKHTKCGIR